MRASVGGARARLRSALDVLRGGKLTPSRFAWSVALGLFIGCLPLYGAHLALCAGIGLLLRLDILVAYTFANISIPPMIPVLLYASAQLGSLVLHGHSANLGLSSFRMEQAGELGGSILVGSVVLGSLTSCVGGTLAFVGASLWSKRQGEALGRKEEAIQRTSARYRSAPAAHRYYVKSKLRMDPLTGELFELLAQQTSWGEVLDVGCGRGQFSWLLVEAGATKKVRGFDHDAEKVNVAVAAAHPDEDVVFCCGDMRTSALGSPQTVLLLDVLHYLCAEDQRMVISRIAAALQPGGRVLLRETNQGTRGGTWAACLEKLARLFGINRGESLTFLSPAELTQLLVGLGLQVESRTGRGPLDNVLLLAKKSPL